MKITLKVLGAVKEHFPDTKNFIEDMIDEQCQKEKISVEEVFFFNKCRSKKLAQNSYLLYSCYFLFLAVGKLWNQEEDEASRQRWNKKAAVRVNHYKQCHRNRWNKQAS